jgi:hypothetical protein
MKSVTYKIAYDRIQFVVKQVDTAIRNLCSVNIETGGSLSS